MRSGSFSGPRRRSIPNRSVHEGPTPGSLSNPGSLLRLLPSFWLEILASKGKKVRTLKCQWRSVSARLGSQAAIGTLQQNRAWFYNLGAAISLRSPSGQSLTPFPYQQLRLRWEAQVL